MNLEKSWKKDTYSQYTTIKDKNWFCTWIGEEIERKWTLNGRIPVEDERVGGKAWKKVGELESLISSFRKIISKEVDKLKRKG